LYQAVTIFISMRWSVRVVLPDGTEAAMALLLLIIALLALDLLALRFGAESREGFEVRRPTLTSETTGPERLVVGRPR
jgi:hypothetical protein